MPQKSQGALLSVATAALAAKTVTGVTNANPGVASSAAHGLAAGTIGVMSALVGMTELNSRALIVANPLSGTFELRGVDTTAYGAYSSGGSFTPQTMTPIGEVKGIPTLFDGESSEIDVTHLRSTAKEFMLGLQDFGGASLTVFLPNPNDAGQTRLRTLKALAQVAAFSLVLPSGQIAAFMAYVKSFAIQNIEPDGTVQAAISLRTANEPSFLS